MTTTLRIRGIPSTTTKHDLSKALKVRSDCTSLTRTDPTTSTATTTTKAAAAAAAAAASNDDGGGQTATVTFRTRRAANKFRSQRRQPKCLGRRPRIDADFLGLTVLASSAADDVEFVSLPSPCSHLPLPLPLSLPPWPARGTDG